MGDCGCGDFRGDFKFKGPDNCWYVLEIYPSCDLCDTSAGITLYKFTEEDLKEWAAEGLPEISITYEGKGVEVIHPKLLIDRLFKAGTIQDEMEDDIYLEFKEAVWETHKLLNLKIQNCDR